MDLNKAEKQNKKITRAFFFRHVSLTFEEHAQDVHIHRRLAAKSNMADVPENAPERKIKLYNFPLVFSDLKK